MIRGLYTSALGMTSQMKKMDVVSNNIANLNTGGFKRDVVVSRAFTDEITHRIDDISDTKKNPKIGKMSLGVFVDEVVTDFTTGALINTGANLDVAISGQGFFSIQITDKKGNVTEKYSRDGAFTLASDGTLSTKSGGVVLGNEGPIVLNSADVTIDENGNVYSNNELVDTLKLVDIEDVGTLRKFGDNLFETTKDSNVKPFTGTTIQNFLENSNINSVREMIEMITLSRVYETNQKMIGIHDTILAKAVNDIGRK
jgi:flagellar basal-body rod protein FlgF